MMPKTHFFSGIVASSILYFSFDVSALATLVFLKAAVLIDVDHYLFYVWNKRDWSLKRAFNLFLLKKKKYEAMSREERKKVMKGFWFLHGLEWILLFGVLGYFVWDLFYFVALGFLFHLILDWIDLARKVGRWDKIFVFWDWKKFRRLERL